MVRRVGHVDGCGAELLGPGDILRCDPHPGEEVTPGCETSLSAIQDGSVAVLDEAFCGQLRDYPAVTANLVARAMARSQALAVSMAIAHSPRIERRVHATLWLPGPALGSRLA